MKRFEQPYCRSKSFELLSLFPMLKTVKNNVNLASCHALLIQRQNASLPSWICGLGIRTALHLKDTNSNYTQLGNRGLWVRLPSGGTRIETSPVAQLAEHW